MGAILSIVCSAAFCLERVLTWSCCAFLIVTILLIMVLLMIYGIAIGYHYAQKELAGFALSSRTTTKPPSFLRSDDEERPVVRLLAVNGSETEQQQYELETKQPDARVYVETSQTPVFLLETERSVPHAELTPNEKDLARRLIGRFRRSRHNTSTTTTTTTTRKPFLRPLRSTSSVLLAT